MEASEAVSGDQTNKTKEKNCAKNLRSITFFI
jgi:hypothetical protein